MDHFTHHPSGVAPVGPGEVQEHHLPHPGGHDAAVPRRLSSVLPILPLAPPGLSPQGLGHRSRQSWRPGLP
jgi:hypothetical protein